jgi:hypothetical protein
LGAPTDGAAPPRSGDYKALRLCPAAPAAHPFTSIPAASHRPRNRVTVRCQDYGLAEDGAPGQKYMPMVVKRVHRVPVYGVPNMSEVSTAYVERNNLTMRMSIRRFTRLTNGFSKKAENLQRALALNFMHYNFCRKHQSIKTTPAIRAGLTDRMWTMHDLANLPDLMDGGLAA